MRYYIADQHFFHGELNEHMDMRGFAGPEEMNLYMVSQWNKKVQRNDEVVILGDLSFGKGRETNKILDMLKGKLYLIEGNHDRYLKDKEFRAGRFEWVKPYAELHDNKRKVVLSHYPVFCYNGQYRVDEDGNPKTYMMYGHVHDTFDERLMETFIDITRASVRSQRGSDGPRPIPCNMINCFCKFSDYIPLSLDEWIALDARRRGRIYHIF